MIYLLPTWGPCFYVPELYSSLPPSPSGDMQLDLWNKHLTKLSDPQAPTLFLISGLPSLHVAVVVLGSVYLRRVSRLLAALSWVFAGLTVLSTLYLGWHYIWDDIASLVLVWIALRLANRWEGR